jgi:ABC-type transporter Mla MlaB component
VVGSCRHASSQWTAAHAILHLSTCCGLPAKTRLDSWKEIAAHLKRSVRTSRCWEAEEDLLELRRQMQSRDSQIALDLEDVTLVDATAVGFLADCESEGVTLQRGSPYILAWIDREREGNG